MDMLCWSLASLTLDPVLGYMELSSLLSREEMLGQKASHLVFLFFSLIFEYPEIISSRSSYNQEIDDIKQKASKIIILRL